MKKEFRVPHLYLLIVILFVFNQSCKSDKDPNPGENLFISAEDKGSVSKQEFSSSLNQALGPNSNQISPFIQFGYEKYRIIYKTTNTDGTKINASGALFVPLDNTQPMALASLQHGTINNEADAPSYFNQQSEGILGAFLASTGIITAMPDYIGYGESKDLEHPYETRQGLSQPTVDFLLAVKQFINSKSLNWNGNLMLSGYSEGGYANMATQKLIESNYNENFKLVASVSGAGAYNKSASFEYLLKNGTTGNTTYNRSYIWVILNYNRIYGLNRPMTYYFKEPWASEITQNGKNVSIDLSLGEIITDEFKDGILSKTDTQLLNAIKDNDIYDWKPSTITRLYHGTADNYVPYLNTQTAFDAMKKRGSENVSLYAIEGGDHGSSISDYIFGTFELFTVSKNL